MLLILQILHKMWILDGKGVKKKAKGLKLLPKNYLSASLFEAEIVCDKTIVLHTLTYCIVLPHICIAHATHAIVAGRRKSNEKSKGTPHLIRFLPGSQLLLNHETLWTSAYCFFTAILWIAVCLPGIKWPSRTKTCSGCPQNCNTCDGKIKVKTA